MRRINANTTLLRRIDVDPMCPALMFSFFKENFDNNLLYYITREELWKVYFIDDGRYVCKPIEYLNESTFKMPRATLSLK